MTGSCPVVPSAISPPRFFVRVVAFEQRTILGSSLALSEAEVHWRGFFHRLVQRGLCGVNFIVSDDHPGMAAARQAVFGPVPWQRCQFHLQQNAQAYVRRLEQRAEVARAIRRIFECASCTAAEQQLKEIVTHCAKSAPKLAAWLEESLPHGFTIFTLPAARCSPAKAAHLQRVGTRQPGTQTPHPRGPASSPMKNSSCA